MLYCLIDVPASIYLGRPLFLTQNYFLNGELDFSSDICSIGWFEEDMIPKLNQKWCNECYFIIPYDCVTKNFIGL